MLLWAETIKGEFFGLCVGKQVLVVCTPNLSTSEAPMCVELPLSLAVS